MEPAMEGVWRWTGDNQLMFTPNTDWPADKKYRITFDKSLFAPHVLLEHYEVEAKTPPFAATMTKIEFYTDPTDPAVKQVVATFEFTHRVDPVELEKRLSPALIAGSEAWPGSWFGGGIGYHR